MKHPHDPIIRDWLDGVPVQYLDTDKNLWIDLAPPDRVHKLPRFEPESQYRRKPVTYRYRVALVKGAGLMLARDLEEEANVGRWAMFERWLTPWIEISGDQGS